MPHFEDYHRKELRRIFTELADFIHEHEITQIIGAGPSAYFYTHALDVAYKNRHGNKARGLHVVNLGTLAEQDHMRGTAPALPGSELKRFLARHKPGLNLGKKSLILDDVARTGFSMHSLSRAFSAAGLPHKTAVIARVSLMRKGFWPLPDYVGSENIQMNRVHVERGRRFATGRPPRTWPAVVRNLHAELREIASEVERRK